METLGQLWEHYKIEFIIALIIVVIGFLRKALSALLTAIFATVKIYGKWDTKLDRGNGPLEHEKAELHQFIHFVWGSTTDNKHAGYRVHGRITGDRLCMGYRQVGHAWDSGAILLEISAGGGEMNGYELGVDHANNQVYSHVYKWTRRE